MRMILTSKQLVTLTETYADYGLKEFIKFSIEFKDDKELVIPFYEVTFEERSYPFILAFMLKVGISHGKKGLS